MLDAFVTVMYRNALDSLRRSFSFKDLTQLEPELRLRTIKGDWDVGDREDSSDAFIVTCARERLFGRTAPWIAASQDRAIARWLDDATDDPQEKFSAAMTALYRKMLELPETLPRWQVHIAAAYLLRDQEGAGDEGGSGGAGVGSADRAPSRRDGDADRRLAAELATLRNAFYDDVSAQWSGPLGVVLAEMERRPRPGIGLDTIVSLLQTFLNGLVLRRVIDADAFGDQEEATIGRATLALLEGLTEPDAAPSDGATSAPVIAGSAAPDEVTGDRPEVGDGVRQRAAEATIELYRRQATNGSRSPDVVRREDVLAHLRSGPAGIDPGDPDLDATFDARYPDMASLHDAALRRRLARRVDAALAMRDQRPGSVLRQIAANVMQLTRTDPALLRACVRDRGQRAPSYLDEVEGVLADLFAQVGARCPVDAASTLLDRALHGDGKTVNTLLAMAGGGHDAVAAR